MIEELFMEELFRKLRLVLVDRLFENADNQRLVGLRVHMIGELNSRPAG